MTELDAPALWNLAVDLSHTLVADYARRADLTALGGYDFAPYEQQLAASLAPGVVAFVACLSAALPSDFDLLPVLTQFGRDPETATALNRYGEDAAAGITAIAAVLTKIGLPAGQMEANALGTALAAWSAASAEVARLNAHLDMTQQALAVTPLYSQQHPPAAEALYADMARLVQALAYQGLSRVAAGDILAADGYTILFSWRRGQSGAQAEPPESAKPESLPDSAVGEIPGGLEDLLSGTGTEPLPAPPLPVQPAPIPPAPGVPSPVLTLRLDTAAPPQVTVGIPFDLAASVRQLASPALDIADLSLQESASFAAILPSGAAFLAMRIQIAAPECDILGGDTRPVRVLPGQDGPTVYFQLTPRHAGPLSIIVTVYQEMDWIGSARLRTEAAGGNDGGQTVAAPRGAVALTVNSQPLAPAEVNLKTLRDALDKGYSLSELQDLCFELEIDYEDLPGEGQAAKARELVLFCKRRDLLAVLVEHVMRDRPLLLGDRG